MTKLSAPTPTPSVPKRPAGRYIDFVARPKTGAKTAQSAPKTIQTAPKTTPRPAPKPIQASRPAIHAPKPTSRPIQASKPAAPAPVEAVPRHRHIAPKGLRMDFVRRPTSNPLPEVKVKKSVQISIAAPKAEVVSETQAPRRVVRQIRPTIIETEEPEELIEPEDENVEPLMDDTEPLIDDNDDLSLALAGFADDDDSLPSLTDSRSKEVADLEEELNTLDELDAISDDLEAEIADFVDEPKPMFEKSGKTEELERLVEKAGQSRKADAPDANRFTLGGRSPFLSSVKVEKRPLSSLVPDEDIQPIRKETKTPLKNAYRAKIKQVLKSDDKEVVHRETTIVSTPNTPVHNISLAIAILLTIILGALIGAVVYLVFFQK